MRSSYTPSLRRFNKKLADVEEDFKQMATDPAIDRDFDRRLDFNEFREGAKKLKLKMKISKAKKEFNEMDANGGGVVLFDEFCVWYTKKVTPEREIADCTSQFVKKRKFKKAKRLSNKTML